LSTDLGDAPPTLNTYPLDTLASVDEWLRLHGRWLRDFRRDIHAHPELSWQETRTTAAVFDALTSAGLTPRRLSTPGLVCDLGRTTGPRIALRADLDALPIPESTGLAYSSTISGVSHACGHDLHTAALVGAGLALASLPTLPVGVRLISQPAEEVVPGGALSVVRDGTLKGVTEVYALHCDPKLKVGTVGVRQGAITSATDQLEVVLHSAGGHTSRPHLTTDLVYGLGTVILGLPGVLSRRLDPRSGTVMVWGAAHTGSAPNAIPQTGTLRATVRTGDLQVWETLEEVVREAIDGLLRPLRMDFETTYQRGVPPVVNDDFAATRIASVVRAIAPRGVRDTPQSSGGEDFAWYLQDTPGAFARLGVWPGEDKQFDLHQPDFTVDERALGFAVRILTGLILTGTPEHQTLATAFEHDSTIRLNNRPNGRIIV
jgi:amidohydrolase